MTEKFHFTADGVDYSLPYASNLKAGLKADLIEAMTLVSKSPEENAWILYRVMFNIGASESPETELALKNIPDSEFFDLIRDWTKATPSTPGK